LQSQMQYFMRHFYITIVNKFTSGH
jgi:hypothetical protein